MEEYISEVLYPIYFRQADAEKLAAEIKNRHSIVLLGMKRVGISNFLRFFLYHNQVRETFLNDGQKHLLIPIDLNDMVEREIFPFWILTFKRIVDAIENSTIPQETKKEVENLFLNSIQLNDQFMMIENIRKTLTKIIDLGFIPTIFFIRLDRLQDAASENLFANLKGLQDSMHTKLSYVITCYRPLESFIPKLEKTFLSSFTLPMYLSTASSQDQEVLLDTFGLRYNLKLNDQQKKQLFALTGGHIRLLQLALIFLHENSKLPFEKAIQKLKNDERITLQCEELWESLSKEEQIVLKKIIENKFDDDISLNQKYLLETGFIVKSQTSYQVFSQLFENYIKNETSSADKNESVAEFTKKELALFNFLKKNINEVCERDAIIEAVWTDEEEALEVSDWAMDRLVARVRAKLKKQKANYEILTIRTRGYKLIET